MSFVFTYACGGTGVGAGFGAFAILFNLQLITYDWRRIN